MNKRAMLLTQVLMTGMMAFLMSGIMSLIALGPAGFSLSGWMGQFAYAWPIAFVLTKVLFPISMRLSGAILGKRAGNRPLPVGASRG